jgi:hypothetical protein
VLAPLDLDGEGLETGDLGRSTSNAGYSCRDDP